MHRVQQFHCRACIRCHGNVFTVALSSNVNGGHRHTDCNVISKLSHFYNIEKKGSNHGLNTARGTAVYLYSSALSSAGKGLTTYRSSVQGILPDIYKGFTTSELILN
jgi:hypothetical protein